MYNIQDILYNTSKFKYHSMDTQYHINSKIIHFKHFTNNSQIFPINPKFNSIHNHKYTLTNEDLHLAST